MASMAISTTLLFVLLMYSTLGAAQQALKAYECQDANGNYTSGSTYKTNLNALLASISSNTNISYGFFNFSAGKSPDQVNGLALCRGDVGYSDCHTCLDFVISSVTQLCPVQKEAIGFADKCMLRYSNRSIFSVWEEELFFVLPNGSFTGNDAQFSSVQQSLMDSVKNNAASGDSRLKFAVQEEPLPVRQQIMEKGFFFRLVISDMSYISFITPLFHLQLRDQHRNLALVVRHWMLFTGKSSSSSIVFIVVAVVASLGLLGIILLYWLFRTRRKLWQKLKIKLDEGDEIGGVQSLQYDLDTIKAATGNFSEVNKVGSGGYGDVYKGTMANGREIAVKRLTKISGEGESEFKNEVVVVVKLQHRNLVRLLGFCLEDQERLLIYEFVPNASLDHFLFDETKRKQLDWESRYEIIGGIARGLLYLHEGSSLGIIHRDLKPGNVLLDSELRPKIADFGTVRLFQVDQTQLDTCRIVGTHGYMAPEYALHGFFSVKSDVYSFGVLVLEIITGQKCINFHNDGEEFENLVAMVWKKWNIDKALDIVDPMIPLEGLEGEIMRCIHTALLCVQETAADRPTMSKVVHMLSEQDFELDEPYQPSFVMTSNTTGLTAD